MNITKAQEPRISKRQQALLAYIRSEGKGQVDILAQHFKVTPQTIRRDLNMLCNLRLLLRVHGGATSTSSISNSDNPVNLDYTTRKLIGHDAKSTIGKRAAELISNDASLFINIGTTTEQVAHYLTNHLGLFVITNNINIANTLRRSEAIKVMTAGGLVRHEDGGIVGNATEDFINQFKADFAVIGCSAMDEDGTILDFDVREVRVTQAIINNARSVILVADQSKFQRKAPVRLGQIASIDYFVTDQKPMQRFLDICEQHQVEVIITSEQPEQKT